MNSESIKNEGFVKDNLDLLLKTNDIKTCEKNITYLVNQYNKGTVIEISDIFKEFDNAYYCKNKTQDIVSSIIMHSSNINYEYKDLTDFKLKTKKNVWIYDETISSTIPLQSLIPDFSVSIINLGFEGIDSSIDQLNVVITNSLVDVNIEKKIPIKQTLKEIGESMTIKVSGVPCPQVPYEYQVKFQFLSNSALCVEKKIHSINVGVK